jgi:mannose-6-phosphate isomerase-like protein (cupin superfamily)
MGKLAAGRHIALAATFFHGLALPTNSLNYQLQRHSSPLTKQERSTLTDFIRRLDESAEYFFKEGCHIIEVSNSEQDPELSVARARLEPGKTTAWHRLSHCTERYVIIAGSGMVEVGEAKPQHVTPGDVVIIPPGTRQRIHNGNSSDLLFLALCTPRFKSEYYEELV